jgi:putative heme-binding domain-containing protein
LSKQTLAAYKEERDPVVRLRLLWAAHAAGALPLDDLEQAFAAAGDEHERVWRLRLLMDRYSPEGEQVPLELAATLGRLAHSESSGLVQLYLASALQRLPLAHRWPLAEALCSHSQFALDRMLPLMIWYGIEPAVGRDRDRAVRLAASSQIPLVRQYIARRLTEEIDTEPAPINALIELAQNNAAHANEILAGMAEALRGWSKAPQPDAWASASGQFATSDSETVKTLAQELGIVFGDGRAAEQLRAILLNADAEASARRQALRTLLVGKPADLVGTLQDLAGDRVVAIEAIRGLASYDHADTPDRLLRFWQQYGPAERSEVINTLCARPEYARALLNLLRDGKLPKRDLSALHARQIQSFGNVELNHQLQELWGDVRASSVDKRRLIERLKSQVTPEQLTTADVSQGRALFQKSCANCHVLYGMGRLVGPDLTGSNRKNLDYLLENVIDPSASVGADFRAWTVALDDGRILNGVIAAESDRTVTLQTAEDTVTVDRNTVAEMQQTSNSLMPDGLLQNLTDDEVRNLIAYLMSSEQVELPRE